MIDGLKLTFSGEQLRTLLEQSMRRHEQEAGRWTHETRRTADDETDEAPLLPEHVCEHEAERHTWRATVLAFLRDHVDASETYRLGAVDLAYGELLPAKPEWLEQDEYEERTRVGFALERLVKSADRQVGPPTMTETVIEASGGFRSTRIDIEDEPEIVKIERT